MTDTLCHYPSPLHLSDAGISPVTPTLSRRQPSAPPSTAKTQIARRNITLPSAARATDSTVAVLARPPSQPEIQKTNQNAGAKSP
jgi:hypothetical protein